MASSEEDRQLRSAALRNADAIFSARQNAERRSEFYLNEGQRLAHMGSWAFNTSGFFEYWSHELFRIYGLDSVNGAPTPEEYLALVHPQDRDLMAATLGTMLAEGTGCDVRSRIVRPGGELRYVRSVGVPIFDMGKLKSIVGTTIDITEQEERTRIEERLRQAEKMEALGRLAGGVAHDFSNVLVGILGYGEMLLEEAPADSPLAHYAQNVLTAANRGRALVEQIFAYSRMQRSTRAPVHLAAVVAETLDLVLGSLPADIRLEARVPDEPLIVLGDATQLHQVVMNLCGNAIEAMSGSGSLRVSLAAANIDSQTVVSHGALMPGRYASLTVADSGSGMDVETLSRIFEPFFTTKQTGRGTGLGLSIVYAIVTDLGGAIDVKSAVKQGTTIAMYLPLIEGA